MNVFRRISRAISRFEERVGPTLAAESIAHSEEMGGTHVDPGALRFLQHEFERERSKEEPDSER